MSKKHVFDAHFAQICAFWTKKRSKKCSVVGVKRNKWVGKCDKCPFGGAIKIGCEARS